MIPAALFNTITDDPVLAHELRARMRGAGAFWMIFAYQAIVAAVLGYAAFVTVLPAGPDSSNEPSGVALFGTIVAVQALLIALIAPALTCGAISLERQRHTYEVLATTGISAGRLVTSKLISSLAFLVLCLGASLPLVMACAAFGGVSMGDVLAAYALLTLEAALFGSIGIFWSSTLRNTLAATVLAYLSVFAACILTAVPGIITLTQIWTPGYNAGSAGFSVLGSLCPFIAGIASSSSSPFYNLDLPFWLPGLIIGPIAILLVVALAEDQVDLFTRKGRSWSRVLAISLIALVTFILSGGLLSNVSQSDTLVANLWSVPLVLLIIGIPFALADDSRPVRSPASGWARWIRAGLWFAIATGIAARSASAVFLLNLRTESERMVVPLTPVLLVLGAFLLAEGSFSRLLYQNTRNRTATYLGPVIAALLAIALPLMIGGTTLGWCWKALYLTPLTAVLSLTPDGLPNDWRYRAGSGIDSWALQGAWWVTSVEIYLTAAVLFGTLGILARWREKRREQRPLTADR